jgi:hypothetical protein
MDFIEDAWYWAFSGVTVLLRGRIVTMVVQGVERSAARRNDQRFQEYGYTGSKCSELGEEVIIQDAE